MSIPDGGEYDKDGGVALNGRDSTYLCLLAQGPKKELADDIIKNKLVGIAQEIGMCIFDGERQFDPRVVGAATVFIDWAVRAAAEARRKIKSGKPKSGKPKSGKPKSK